MAHPPLDQAQVLRRRLEETTRDLAAARAAHDNWTGTAGAFELMPLVAEAVKRETMHHMRVFGSDGKA